MPTYQYVCTECGEPLEVVQAFTDDALTECPECKGALRKVYGSVGVVFKGSGFYRNDSRATTTSSDKPASTPTPSSGSDSSSSTTSTPASTPAATPSTSTPSST